MAYRGHLEGGAGPQDRHGGADAAAGETDAAFDGAEEYAEALRGVLNNGYTRGKPYTTCIGQGAGIKAHDFKVFCPKAIAGIGKLPDTVADRSIPIELKRRAPTEHVERFRQRRAEEQGARLANALHQLRETDGFAALDGVEPDLPDELDDRAQDVWEPLFALADLAGGESGPSAPARPPSGSRAGASWKTTRSGFGCSPIASRRSTDARRSRPGLVSHLNGLEEASWQGWGKQRAEPGLTARDLAYLLRPYAIRSTDVHQVEGTSRHTLRGYRRESFEDAWDRYLPSRGGLTSPSTPMA